MRRILAFLGAAGAVVVLAAAWWTRNRRAGTRFVNRVVNPVLLRRRLAGSGRSEVGMLEHVGRRSGIRRLTPVHPERTVDGFRIVVPLAWESEWARNVIAAGHCRLQLHDVVYDLDEPRMISPEEVDGVPRLVRRLEAALGFRYLTLRTFARATGQLDESAAADAAAEGVEAVEAVEAVEPALAAGPSS